MGYSYEVTAALYAPTRSYTHRDLRERLNERVPEVFATYPAGHWRDIMCRVVKPGSSEYTTVPCLLFTAWELTCTPWGRDLYDLSEELAEHGVTLEFAYLGGDWDDASCDSVVSGFTHVLSLTRAIAVSELKED